MQQHTPVSSLKMDFKTFLIRLGKIFSNISIFFLVLCFCGILSFVSTVFIFLIGLVIIILSIGTIFAIIPNYWQSLTSITQISVEISNFFLQNFYIFAIIAILCSILALVLLLLDKQTKHTARIVVSCVVIGIVIISIIVVATGVIK